MYRLHNLWDGLVWRKDITIMRTLVWLMRSVVGMAGMGAYAFVDDLEEAEGYLVELERDFRKWQES